MTSEGNLATSKKPETCAPHLPEIYLHQLRQTRTVMLWLKQLAGIIGFKQQRFIFLSCYLSLTSQPGVCSMSTSLRTQPDSASLSGTPIVTIVRRKGHAAHRLTEASKAQSSATASHTGPHTFENIGKCNPWHSHGLVVGR